MSLKDLGIEAKLHFKEGRPTLQHPGGKLSLNGESLATGDLQLIHGDLLTIAGFEIEVDAHGSLIARLHTCEK